MSGLPLKIEPEATDDYRAAAKWYESQVPGLSADFEAEIDKILQKVILNPTLYRIIDKHFKIRQFSWLAFHSRCSTSLRPTKS